MERLPKTKWKIGPPSSFWKDEYVEIRIHERGESLCQILSRLEDSLKKSDAFVATYLLEIPKDLVSNSGSIEHERLVISPRKFLNHESGRINFFWSLNIFKNYRPYRDWFSSRVRCQDNLIFNKSSADEFELMVEDFFRYLKLQGFA